MAYRKWIRQRGIATIEFATVIIFFLASLLFIAEMCRIIYLASVIDLVLAESGRVASITTSAQNYQRHFSQEINRRLAGWPLLAREFSTTLSIHFCQDINAIINDRCNETTAADMPLALYQVDARYRPLFLLFPASLGEQMLSRRLVFIQEFQRLND